MSIVQADRWLYVCPAWCEVNLAVDGGSANSSRSPGVNLKRKVLYAQMGGRMKPGQINRHGVQPRPGDVGQEARQCAEAPSPDPPQCLRRTPLGVIKMRYV